METGAEGRTEAEDGAEDGAEAEARTEFRAGEGAGVEARDEARGGGEGGLGLPVSLPCFTLLHRKELTLQTQKRSWNPWQIGWIRSRNELR